MDQREAVGTCRVLTLETEKKRRVFDRKIKKADNSFRRRSADMDGR